MTARSSAPSRLTWLASAALFAVLSIALSNRHGLRTLASNFGRALMAWNAAHRSYPLRVAFGDTYRSDPWFATSVGIALVALLLWAIFGARARRFLYTAFAIAVCVGLVGVAGVGLRPPTTWLDDQTYYLSRAILGCDALTFVGVLGALVCAGIASFTPRGDPPAFDTPGAPGLRAVIIGTVGCVVLMLALRAGLRPLGRPHLLAPVFIVGAALGLVKRRLRAADVGAVFGAVWLADLAAWNYCFAREARTLFDRVSITGRVLEASDTSALAAVEMKSLALALGDVALTTLFCVLLFRSRRTAFSRMRNAVVLLVCFFALAAESVGIARSVFFTPPLTEAIPTTDEDVSRLLVADRRPHPEPRLASLAFAPNATWREVAARMPPYVPFAWLLASSTHRTPRRRLQLFAALTGDHTRAILVERGDRVGDRVGVVVPDRSEAEGETRPDDLASLAARDVSPYSTWLLPVDEDESVAHITNRLVRVSNVMLDRAGVTVRDFSPRIALVPRGAMPSDAENHGPSTSRVVPRDARQASGCNATAVAGGVRTVADNRTYLLVAPKRAGSAGTRAPLVVALHGGGGMGSHMQAQLAMEDVATDAYVAYPDGRSGTWDFTTPLPYNADVAFLDALIDDVGRTFCVDATRVYMAGYSMGGYLMQEYACARPGRLAGIASFEAGGPWGAFVGRDEEGRARCAPVRALIVHAPEDGNVAVSEGLRTRDVRRAAAACDARVIAREPAPCVEYMHCASAARVAWCAVPNVGHQVWDRGAAAAWAFWNAP